MSDIPKSYKIRQVRAFLDILTNSNLNQYTFSSIHNTLTLMFETIKEIDLDSLRVDQVCSLLDVLIKVDFNHHSFVSIQNILMLIDEILETIEIKAEVRM